VNRRDVGVSLVIGLLLGAGATYALAGQSQAPRTLTKTSTVVSTTSTVSTTTVLSNFTTTSTKVVPIYNEPETASTTNSSIGLGLALTINATYLTVGQSLQVNVSVFNTLSSVNTIPIPSQGNSLDFSGIPVAIWSPCFIPGSGAEAVLLPGNYTLQELPTVANYSYSYNCTVGTTLDHVIFAPYSSKANFTGIYSESVPVSKTVPGGPYQLSVNFTTNGYWSLLNNSERENPPFIGEQDPVWQPTATAFVPGVYTLAVEDEWGQTAVLHFIVMASGT